MFSRESINRFKENYQKEFGEEISDEKALELMEAETTKEPEIKKVVSIEEMPRMVKVAKICLQIMGWIYILVFTGFLVWNVAIFIKILSTDQPNTRGIIMTAFTFGLFFLFSFAIAIFILLTARGISNKKSWSKITGIIFGVIAFITPLTILGIFILMGLLGGEANGWFDA
jgi:hypothetical protein